MRAFLVLFFLPFVGMSQFHGGVQDGFGNGSFSGIVNEPVQGILYIGGQGDGYAAASFSGAFDPSVSVLSYVGGVSDGFARGVFSGTLTGTEEAALYFGGASDGFSKATISFSLNAELSKIYYFGGNGDGGAVGTSASIPLPIELLYFDVVIRDEVVWLEWASASEIDNDRFEVQRSKDGTDFQVLGEVKGAGTTSQIQEYQFTDVNPYLGHNYYRLKQIDYDGAYEYSPLRSVVFELTNSIQLVIYPNPAKDRVLNVQIEGILPESDLELRIYHPEGRLLIAKTFSKTLVVELPLSWPEGLYQLTVATDTDVLTKKFVILNK